MSTPKSICVYCGAAKGDDPAHRAAAERLGKLMAESGIRLVFGGGRIGMMGIIADAVMSNGGEVIGVIPEHLHDIEVGHDGLTELHVVDSMHTRKNKMFELSDAFVVMPGGLGTMDETFEIITWRQLGLHDKPVILVNNNKYWEPFRALVQHIIDNGYARENCIDLFTIVDGIDDVIPAIENAPKERFDPLAKVF